MKPKWHFTLQSFYGWGLSIGYKPGRLVNSDLALYPCFWIEVGPFQLTWMQYILGDHN